ncbi:MAG: nucleotidyl transferase AbiEii/AbiGii toxin family protein [Desulfitobacteriaceae bacterium]
MVGGEYESQDKAARTPVIEDLIKVCQALNDHGVKYLLIGGFAVNYYGFDRATSDIDFLVDAERENIQRIKDALSILEDNAISAVEITDVAEYNVVRVVDEITIDLIHKIGDIDFSNASTIEAVVEGVSIPIANLDTLIQTKKGMREKDKIDLAFLIKVMDQSK